MSKEREEVSEGEETVEQVSSAISGTMRGRKPIWFGLPEAGRGEAPRGVQEGTESSPGDALCRTPGYSHLAQPAEPPYADPHVRWCGRGGQATVPPIPIASYL